MKLLSISMVALILSLKSMAQTPQPVVVERGPHHQTVQTVRQFVDDLGRTVTETNSFVQLTPGLHWFDRRTEGWEETKEEFEIAPNGRALARSGQHQVVLSPNIATRGAVDLTTSDGKRFQSHVFGISYFDPSSGQSVLIAEVKDSIGELVAPNQVVFPDAFTDFHADLRMTYTKSGFEQDVILRARPPSPEQWGISPATAQLQVLTEFIDPPVPLDRVGSTNTEPDRFFIAPNLTDERLDFGAMMIGQGKAFSVDDTGDPSPIDLADDKVVPVGKNWSELEGRHFLIESVNYATIAPALEGLPAAPQASVDRPRRKVSRLADVVRERPQRVASVLRPDAKESIVVAKAGRSGGKGYVIDYVILNTIANHTLKGDTTYYLTNTATLSGVSIIEGGAVVKYTNGAQLKFAGTVKCQTSAYRPAVFTSKDDDTVGESISGSTGNPSTNYLASTALYFDNNQSDLRYIRVAHADQAVYYDSDTGYPHFLSHAQIVHCRKGILPHNTAFHVRNVLMHDVLTNFYNTTHNATGYVHHLTANTAAYLNGSSSLITLNVTNSLLVAVTNVGTISGSSNATNSSPSSVFQTVGAGNHYLASGSSYRNAGTTNICETLKADLATMTTYPPIVLTNTYTTSLVLSPQAERDTDTPDIGYHYLPIDYAVNTLTMTNATLTLTNGVSLVTFGTIGIWLQDGSQLFSEGTPINRNHLARFFNVQEQSTNWGGAAPGSVSTINPYTYGSVRPTAQFRFTDFDGMSNCGNHLFTFCTNWAFSSMLVQDCSFNSGSVNWECAPTTSLSLKNNLFERVSSFWYDVPQIDFYNNLYRYGSIFTVNFGTNNWTVKDNAFDSTSITDIGSALTAAYNAYIGMGTNRFNPTNANDKVLTSFTYDAGPLGGYYHVSTNLINVGSRNATNAGLYHHTVVLDQTKETNSTVDIGFHYVAVNAAESEFSKASMTASASSSYDGTWTPAKAIDGLLTDAGWHNQAAGWTEEPAWLRIDLGSSKNVSRVGYTGRDGGGNGLYRQYKIYVTASSSTNVVDWGTETAAGYWFWPNGKERRDVEFCPTSGRYVIFRRITADGFGTPPGYANANEIWIYTRNSQFSSAFDYDGDGLPDYFEDSNGNGSVNSGETDWQSGGDLGLKVWITEPKSNSNIP